MSYRDSAIDWARAVLATRETELPAVILDTETTGIRSPAEVVEVAVIDVGGAVLFDERIRPVKAEMTPGAYEVHGIAMADLLDKPTLAELWPRLSGALGHSVYDGRPVAERLVVGYNVRFDYDKLVSSMLANATAYPPDWSMWDCAMLRYSYFRDNYRRARKYSLDNALAYEGVEVGEVAHSAIGDCRRTLALIERMAAG